jgi:hypothetical protein
MDLESQFWESLFAYEGYKTGEPYELDEQAKALLDPPIASTEDVLPENAFMATLLNTKPEHSAWHNVSGYFDHLEASVRRLPNFTDGDDINITTIHSQPPHASSIYPSHPAMLQPAPDGAVFLAFYPDSFGTVPFDYPARTSTFQSAPSQPAVQQTYPDAIVGATATHVPKEIEPATVTPYEKSWIQIPGGVSSSSLDVSVAPANPPSTLPNVEFDCFTGPMIVPPGKEHQPHVSFAILHVHRLRTPPSCSNLEVPPIHGPSGIPYVDLVWNPTCPNLKQQKWKYLSRTLSTNSGPTRKSKSSQTVRCRECGEAFSRQTELDRHQMKSCKMREIFERIQCRRCMRIIAARDDCFVRHLKTCKGPDVSVKEES